MYFFNQQQSEYIKTDDYYKMIGIYVVMYVGRMISFFLFKKQIFTYGYGCTSREFAVFIHGGLRGAVGLSFAMLANADEQLSPALRDIVQ